MTRPVDAVPGRAGTFAVEGSPPAATVSRRRVLAAGAVVSMGTIVSGCTPDDRPPPPPRPPDPDELLLLRVRAAERQLVQLYEATIARHPVLSRALDAVRAEHAAHLAALGTGRLPEPDDASAAPSATDAPSAGLSSSGAAPSPSGTAAAPVQPPGPVIPESPTAAV
ncbi:MAG: hypothetical protein M3P91_12740, partial [Actinomycetota bacterium]|nr:hypothetical protein [Actinomycetota bacterium]